MRHAGPTAFPETCLARNPCPPQERPRVTAAASAVMRVMIDAARKAGRGLARDFGEVGELQVSRKGAADFVSAADLKAEQTLMEELLKARPGYGFLGEERGLVEGTDKTHVWIVDPLDGTTNFLHAMPHFAINIALQREGQIVAGLTFNPANGDLFWSERGKGAFLNDRRLRVAARTRLDEAVFATGIPFLGHGQHARFLKELHQISQRVAGVRRFGAAALDLAWVAAGRFDGFWERDLKPWDMAAGLLMVREAGGVATDAEGGDTALETGSICAANSTLHPLLLERLAAAA
jgi:myo-inositol-1(or 4)-monophosphatase